MRDRCRTKTNSRKRILRKRSRASPPAQRHHPQNQLRPYEDRPLRAQPCEAMIRLQVLGQQPLPVPPNCGIAEQMSKMSRDLLDASTRLPLSTMERAPPSQSIDKCSVALAQTIFPWRSLHKKFRDVITRCFTVSDSSGREPTMRPHHFVARDRSRSLNYRRARAPEYIEAIITLRRQDCYRGLNHRGRSSAPRDASQSALR